MKQDVDWRWYPRPSIFHPLSGTEPDIFRQHHSANKPFDRPARISRALARFTIFARRPFVNGELKKHHEKILAHEISEPPVFIVGHWRSGTTFLHNILSKDPRFGSINFVQTCLPWDCLGKQRLSRAGMSIVLPKTRGMDNVEIGPDEPQEEEIAMGLMQRLSFFNCFYFPRNARKHFRESILFEDVDEQEQEHFASQYDYLVRKMSYAGGGRRMLFKNPANAARLDLLTSIFPGARIIHISRDPFEVYSSTMRLWPSLWEAFSWHRWDDVDVDAMTREFYQLLMGRFIAQRDARPKGEILEVRYDDLKQNPLASIERLYRELEIDFNDEARQPIQEYLGKLSGYVPNKYTLEEKTRDSLREDWGDIIEKLGY